MAPPSSEKKRKKDKKEKKKKKSKSAKKRNREENESVGGDEQVNDKRKRKKQHMGSSNNSKPTIYEQLNQDRDNQLWLVRIPKTLNLQDLDGKEIKLNDGNVLDQKINITSSNINRNNSDEESQSDDDEDMSSTITNSKKQYTLNLAPPNQCSQMVCFLPRSYDYDDEETKIVHPLKFAKQLNFIENMIDLPHTNVKNQRLSMAYKKVPQKSNLNYNLKTIGCVPVGNSNDNTAIIDDSEDDIDGQAVKSTEKKKKSKKDKKEKKKKSKKDKKEKKKKKNKSSK
jgi:hypothetical protein